MKQTVKESLLYKKIFIQDNFWCDKVSYEINFLTQENFLHKNFLHEKTFYIKTSYARRLLENFSWKLLLQDL